MSQNPDEIRARFEQALTCRDAEYVTLEIELRQLPPPAEAVFEEQLQHPDPVARLLARVLLAWVRGESKGTLRAVSYLDQLPEFLAERPYDPDGPSAALYLTKNHEKRAAELLALRLVHSTTWPAWRVDGVLTYLQTCKLSSTTEAILRFAAEDPSPSWRARARATLLSLDDPELRAKAAAERARMIALDRAPPDAIDDFA
jgi:hypothetical protein